MDVHSITAKQKNHFVEIDNFRYEEISCPNEFLFLSVRSEKVTFIADL